MENVLRTRTVREPEYSISEILRYGRCKDADENVLKLLDECLFEVKGKINYRVAYTVLPLKITGRLCDFSEIKLESEALARNLKGCEKAVIFAVTCGTELDRLISKYGRLSPTKALLFDAIGAERVEAIADEFTNELTEELSLKSKPRFSPGYGDLPLNAQKNIFSLLQCEKNLGLYLNESLLMMPCKSVTAIAGLYKTDL